MENIKEKIVGTGGKDDDFLFTHLVLKENEQRELELEFDSIETLAKMLQVDFVSIEKKGTIEFLHITNNENYDSIESKGLLQNEENWIGDLGIGIYVIKKDDEEALENLKDYIMDEKHELLLVKGDYEGPYTECIYGEQHKGYIVLLTEIIEENNINDLETISIDDFLFM